MPNDWTDVEEDRRLQALTVPVRLGLDQANSIILGSLIISVILSTFILFLSPICFEAPFFVGFAATGLCFLLLPAFLLYKTKQPRYAMALFNMASYYPITLLAIVVAKIIAG